MEKSYYEKLKEFLGDEVHKSIINILSPTYALYNNMRIKGNRIKGNKTKEDIVEENKKFNKYLANNTKLFFLSLSLFIVAMISVYDLINMNDESNTYKIIYILLCILPLYISFNYFLNSFDKINLDYQMNSKNTAYFI